MMPRGKFTLMSKKRTRVEKALGIRIHLALGTTHIGEV
jgi:hypothetical protein